MYRPGYVIYKKLQYRLSELVQLGVNDNEERELALLNIGPVHPLMAKLQTEIKNFLKPTILEAEPSGNYLD